MSNCYCGHAAHNHANRRGLCLKCVDKPGLSCRVFRTPPRYYAWTDGNGNYYVLDGHDGGRIVTASMGQRDAIDTARHMVSVSATKARS